jgi:hypothetical protein
MTRVLLAFLLAAVLIGCTSITPVGIMAKKGSSPDAKGKKDKDDPPEPVTVPAPKPTPPMNLVDAGDVSADPQGSLQKLRSELDADKQTIPTSPTTTEISRYKGGVKDN